jgi:ABC-2 type transport system ATP-binding protein
MADNALELAHVSKRFGDLVAVDDVSFVVPKGQIVGFLGANGAGKTTTLRMILNILEPDSGEVRVFGKAPEPVSLRRVGYLPEERGLYRRMRAAPSIAYFAALKGVPLKEANIRAKSLLEYFGLAAFARSRIEGLSKGMAQKVALISAIAHDPDLLILDEPFSGLDPLNQDSLEKLIREKVQQGKTVLFSTHTMVHAERLADRIVIVSHGRIRFDGTQKEARASLPRRVRIAADTDLAFLSMVPGVTQAVPPSESTAAWELELAKQADGRAILAACFNKGVVPAHFEIAEASLHDVFISLAGQTDEAI